MQLSGALLRIIGAAEKVVSYLVTTVNMSHQVLLLHKEINPNGYKMMAEDHLTCLAEAKKIIEDFRDECFSIVERDTEIVSSGIYETLLEIRARKNLDPEVKHELERIMVGKLGEIPTMDKDITQSITRNFSKFFEKIEGMKQEIEKSIAGL